MVEKPPPIHYARASSSSPLYFAPLLSHTNGILQSAGTLTPASRHGVINGQRSLSVSSALKRAAQWGIRGRSARVQVWLERRSSSPTQDLAKFRGGENLTPPYSFFTENNLGNNDNLFSVKEVAPFIFEIVAEVKPD